jgi:hypothetical protein
MDQVLNVDGALRELLGVLVPNFEFRLTDLTQEEDRVLHAWLTTDLGKLVALCLKYAGYEPHLQERLRQWLDLFGRVVRAPGGVGALEVVARYILEVNDINAESLRGVLDSTLEPEAIDAIMTGAEKLRAEGRAEGRAELVLKLLTLRFGPLTEATVACVRAASIEQLDGYAEGVLTAQSLEQVFSAH